MIFFQNPHPSNVHLLKKRNKQRIVKNVRIAFINMLTIYRCRQRGKTKTNRKQNNDDRLARFDR